MIPEVTRQKARAWHTSGRLTIGGIVEVCDAGHGPTDGGEGPTERNLGICKRCQRYINMVADGHYPGVDTLGGAR